MADKDQKQADAANKRVQEQVDSQSSTGLIGVEADPTPNENYTVSGVTQEKPTPETDAEAAAKAKEATSL